MGILIAAAIIVNHDFRSPRRLFHDLFDFEMPADATNIVVTNDRLVCRISFDLSHEKLREFVSTRLPGYEGWRPEFGYVEAQDTGITKKGDFRTNRAERQPGAVSQDIVADWDTNRVVAAYVNTTGL